FLPPLSWSTVAGSVIRAWGRSTERSKCGSYKAPGFRPPRRRVPSRPDGRLRDAALAQRLREETIGFLPLAEALAPVCSGKTEGEAARRQQEIARALEDESSIQPQSA